LRSDLLTFVAVAQGHVLARVVFPRRNETAARVESEDRGRTVFEGGVQLGSVPAVDGQGPA
jgi:hypothetical protein